MGGQGSGRRSRKEEIGDTIQVLRASAPHAAKYLRDIILKKVKKPSWARIHVCEFVIEHEIGKPPQRHELTGAGGTPLTWQAVLMLAQEADRADQPDQGKPPIIEGTAQLIDQAETPAETEG